MSKVKAIFLDRDGTIIVDKVYLNDPEQVEFLPGAIDGLIKLKEAGYQFFVVTNQSGIPRGLITLQNLHQIHERIQDELSRHSLKIQKFYFAPYMTDSNHPLRKPNPGMLLKAVEEFGIDLGSSWMVGDRMLDVEAGHRAGTKSILLEGRETPDSSDFAPPEFIAENLSMAADFILARPH